MLDVLAMLIVISQVTTGQDVLAQLITNRSRDTALV